MLSLVDHLHDAFFHRIYLPNANPLNIPQMCKQPEKVVDRLTRAHNWKLYPLHGEITILTIASLRFDLREQIPWIMYLNVKALGALLGGGCRTMIVVLKIENLLIEDF